MINTHEYSYWIALSHLPKWRIERINMLIVEILHNKNMQLAEFFELSPPSREKEFHLDHKESADIQKAGEYLSNYSFLAEQLLVQGFDIIPISSPDYSPVLKNNLKLKYSPPLLYVKGNRRLLYEPSAAIVGCRKASDISLHFTRTIAEKCAHEEKVVVSGFAKGIDRQALDSVLAYHGKSIIVLPQGIMTFGSGIKKYYKQLVDGDVLVLSTFYPKAPWSVGLAMARNVYIYGLAEEIFVAESDNKGGTWSGVLDGLKKGRTIFVRKADIQEKNTNNILIEKGARGVDLQGNIISLEKEGMHQHIIADNVAAYGLQAENSDSFESKVIQYLNKTKEPRTSRQIKEAINVEEPAQKITQKLKKITGINYTKHKNKIFFFTERTNPLKQQELF